MDTLTPISCPQHLIEQVKEVVCSKHFIPKTKKSSLY
jgi:hypothetical protein